MRVERMSAISSALPSPEFQSMSERPRSFLSPQGEASTSASRVLEEIAMQFDLRDMDASEAVRLADRLMQEELLTSAAHFCLTGVPMRMVAGEGCRSSRSSRSSGERYDYIVEFERYVAFDESEGNLDARELLQSVLNLLCSLDTLRHNGPVDISA